MPLASWFELGDCKKKLGKNKARILISTNYPRQQLVNLSEDKEFIKTKGK
jgi:hypothetical protein